MTQDNANQQHNKKVGQVQSVDSKGQKVAQVNQPIDLSKGN